MHAARRVHDEPAVYEFATPLFGGELERSGRTAGRVDEDLTHPGGDDPLAVMEDLETKALQNPPDLEHAAAGARPGQRGFDGNGQECPARDEHAELPRIQHAHPVTGVPGADLDGIQRRQPPQVDPVAVCSGSGKRIERDRSPGGLSRRSGARGVVTHRGCAFACNNAPDWLSMPESLQLRPFPSARSSPPPRLCLGLSIGEARSHRNSQDRTAASGMAVLWPGRPYGRARPAGR